MRGIRAQWVVPVPTSSSEHDGVLRAFVERLRQFVVDERDAQRRQIERTWHKPVAERVAAGRAIEGVSVRPVTSDGHWLLTCQSNASRFREGDILCLNRGNPFFQPSLMVTLEQDRETSLVVTLADRHRDPGAALDVPTGWVLDEGLLDLSASLIDGLNDAGESAIGRTRVLPLLLNALRPQTDLARYDRALDRAQGLGLNDDQAEAFAQAFATTLAWLVQGPPGTGKTRVLAHLVADLAEDGERVLVTGLTHRAINNALNMLARLAPEVPTVKIGGAHRADDLVGVENAADFTHSGLAELKGGYVIGATPFALRSNRLQGVDFETVVFDEASQITLPLAIMGMLRGKRYVFFGDQCQLPPVLVARQAAQSQAGHSVFAALAEQNIVTMLSETYRLNRELAAWPSATYYEERLRPATRLVAERRVTFGGPIVRLAQVLDPDRPKVFLDLAHRNATTRSLHEAGVVVDLLMALFESGLPPTDVAVVVPYRAQGREIRNLLRQALPDDELRQVVIVDTVERMQGQEREVVIVSLTTSHKRFAAELAEFLFQPERLNVAVTRARAKLIMVGSSQLLAVDPERDEDREALALFRDFLHGCTYCRLE